MAKKAKKKYWAGFHDGHIYKERCSDFDSERCSDFGPPKHYFLSISTPRKVAERKFEDVRPVTIREVE